MEFIEELGVIALGTRIKNLSDLILRDMTKIYKEYNVEFEPRWFTFFQLILREEEISVTQIAHKLNQTHPAIVQVINKLKSKKLIITTKDKFDKRKTLVKLSPKGKLLAEELNPMWQIVLEVSNEVLNEGAPDLLEKISAIEKVLKHKSNYSRIKDKLFQKTIDEAEFMEYSEKYLDEFQQLNADWLNKQLELSDYDIKVISNPTKEIISRNGKIFFLVSGTEVIGTYALRKLNADDCELMKFTVKEKYRRRGLGKLMLDHAVEISKNLSCYSIFLITSPKLVEANNLYIKYGFKLVPNHPDIEDKTCRESITYSFDIY